MQSRIPATTGSTLYRYRAANITADQSPPSVLDLASNGDLLSCDGRRGMIVMPFGVGAEDETFTLALHGLWKLEGGESPQALARLLYTLTVTLGAVTGESGGVINANARLAKTIGLVASAYAGDIEAFSDKAASVRTADGVAELVIPDLANLYGLMPIFTDVGGGGAEADEANLLFAAQT